MDDRRKNYRAWDAQQNCHDSISPRDALPEDDLVFFLLDLIPHLQCAPGAPRTPGIRIPSNCPRSAIAHPPSSGVKPTSP